MWYALPGADAVRGATSHAEAEAAYVDCLRRKRKALGETHASTLLTATNLAHFYEARSRHEEAEALYTDLVAR